MLNQRPPRLGEDWSAWEWALAEKLISTIRQRHRYTKGRVRMLELLVVGSHLGNEDIGKSPREWRIMSLSKQEEARVVQS